MEENPTSRTGARAQPAAGNADAAVIRARELLSSLDRFGRSALRALSELVAHDERLLRQLRVSATSVIEMLSQLSKLERQALSRLGRDLEPVLMELWAKHGVRPASRGGASEELRRGPSWTNANIANQPAIRDETLQRIWEHMRTDPALGRQLRAGPQQAIAQMRYLSARERQELAAHGHGLYDALLSGSHAGGVAVESLTVPTSVPQWQISQWAIGENLPCTGTVFLSYDHQRAPTYKVCQLTGQYDNDPSLVRDVANPSTNYHVRGTDLGIPVEIWDDQTGKGRIYFLFGDTLSTDDRAGSPLHKTMAYADASIVANVTSPTLHWVTGHWDRTTTPKTVWHIDGDREHYLPVGVDGNTDWGGFYTPTGGFANQRHQTMYVFFGLPVNRQPGPPVSVLTYSTFDAPAEFHKLYEFSDNKFIQCASVLNFAFRDYPIPGGGTEGLPVAMSLPSRFSKDATNPGRFAPWGVLVFGTDKSYGPSYVYLAYCSDLDHVEDQTPVPYDPPSQRPRKSGYWLYFAGFNKDPRNGVLGRPLWTTSEDACVPLFEFEDKPFAWGVRELSVAYDPPSGLWLMLYQHGAPGSPAGLILRYAQAPWGPWHLVEQIERNPMAIDPHPAGLIFDDRRYTGLGHFIHRGGDDDHLWNFFDGPNHDGTYNDDLNHYHFSKENWGGPYAPYLVRRWFQSYPDRIVIFYTLSTWLPYQVVLMTTTLQIGCR